MRAGSNALKGVLKGGGFGTRLVVDSFYGATRTATGLGAVGWDLKWDSEGNDSKSNGTIALAEASDDGSSLVPRSFTDKLAVAGQEVNLALEVFTDGGFSERVQLGHYRIVAVTDSSESTTQVNGQQVVVSSSVTLQITDRLIIVKRKGFRSEQNPPSGATCWGEMQRLSGLQVVRNLPDKAMPAGTIYQAQQGGVLEAIQEIANALGGVPYITPDGALSVLPDARGDVVLELVLGDEGTIIDVTDTMESEGIYNVVVGVFEDDNRNPIVVPPAVATSGPFKANADGSGFGEYVKYYASPVVKTESGAKSAIAAILSQSLRGQSYRVVVQCIVNPLVEDGDMVSVERKVGGIIVGRVVKHSLGSANLMDVELDVLRDLS